MVRQAVPNIDDALQRVVERYSG